MASSIYSIDNMLTNGVPDAKGMKIGIVVSEWNNNITQDLLDGATETLEEMGVSTNDIKIQTVPGSFELTFGCAQMIKYGQVDGVIAIGCVIKGDTPHFDYICEGVTEGITQLNASSDIPVIFGVLTTNTLEQAQERAGGIIGNKGKEYAVTVVKMINLARELKKK